MKRAKKIEPQTEPNLKNQAKNRAKNDDYKLMILSVLDFVNYFILTI
jgi:hypothetical protein